MIVLAILNCIALSFVFMLWRALTARYRYLFIAGAAFPLCALALGGMVSGKLMLLSSSWMDIGGFLLRGWLIIAIICGALLCRVVSYYEKR